MDKKCYYCIYYDPCSMKCRLGREPKDCTSNADEYIKKSYRGGWCYLAKGKEKQIKHNGTTADVNSLYPSIMKLTLSTVYGSQVRK